MARPGRSISGQARWSNTVKHAAHLGLEDNNVILGDVDRRAQLLLSLFVWSGVGEGVGNGGRECELPAASIHPGGASPPVTRHPPGSSS